jgi:GxxExxY protein
MTFTKSEYRHSELTGTIIGCAFEVYNELGMGFPEKIYHKELELEFKEKGLILDREHTVPVHFKGILVGKRRLDFVIHQKIVVEVKARPYLHDSDFIQLRNYLKIAKLEIGLLLNFGFTSLQYKRCIQTLNNG